MPINAAHCGELEEIFDDGTNNNYGEWKIKSRSKLRSWDLWKYIEGPESEPPDIPPLVETVGRIGTDDSGHTQTFYVLGNSAEHKQKTEEAKPWMTANNLALAKIVCAVPGAQIHHVEGAIYAKQAWESLRSYYQPGGPFRAPAIKKSIMAFSCAPDMDVAQWLNDMQRLYSSLRDADADGFSDHTFARAILDNMPRDDDWRGLVSKWRLEFLYRAPCPASSAEVISAIREECWWSNRDNPRTYIFSARTDADRQKRLCTPDDTPTSRPTKRPRTLSDKFCTNPHCGTPNGHTFSDCITYGGGSQGQYGLRWRGRWNIHLPPEQRTEANNVPPTSHPAYAIWTGK